METRWEDAALRGNDEEAGGDEERSQCLGTGLEEFDGDVDAGIPERWQHGLG
jgi:hypothetical protein